MKLIFNKSLLVILFFTTTNAFSFEVNTHQAITRCAVASPVMTAISGLEVNDCERNNSAINLHKFTENALLDKEDYPAEVFEKYNRDYFDYAQTGEGFDSWRIGFRSKKYQDLIEAGVILEDSVYPHADIIAQGGDGRFNNHFYSRSYAWRGNAYPHVQRGNEGQ